MNGSRHWVIIGSGNGLLSAQPQLITWSIIDLASVRSYGTNTTLVSVGYTQDINHWVTITQLKLQLHFPGVNVFTKVYTDLLLTSWLHIQATVIYLPGLSYLYCTLQVNQVKIRLEPLQGCLTYDCPSASGATLEESVPLSMPVKQHYMKDSSTIDHLTTTKNNIIRF